MITHTRTGHLPVAHNQALHSQKNRSNPSRTHKHTHFRPLPEFPLFIEGSVLEYKRFPTNQPTVLTEVSDESRSNRKSTDTLIHTHTLSPSPSRSLSPYSSVRPCCAAPCQCFMCVCILFLPAAVLSFFFVRLLLTPAAAVPEGRFSLLKTGSANTEKCVPTGSAPLAAPVCHQTDRIVPDCNRKVSFFLQYQCLLRAASSLATRAFLLLRRRRHLVVRCRRM